MAEDKMAPLELLRKGQEPEGDFLRESMRRLIPELMEAEASAPIGAERYEHTSERTAYRNGYRHRPWDTRLGTMDLAIPKLRSGNSHFPACLEPRRRSEQALGPKWAGNGHVSTSQIGTAVNESNLRRGFHRHLKRAGLPDIRLYDLRHTCATLMLQAGVPVKVVSERLGHSSLVMTLRIYAHVRPSMQQHAARTLGELLGG